MQMAIERARSRAIALALFDIFARRAVSSVVGTKFSVKILLETSPELWAMFTAFSAFGEEYINVHDAEIGKRDCAADRALAGRGRAIEGGRTRALPGNPGARSPVAPVGDPLPCLDCSGQLRPRGASFVCALPARPYRCDRDFASSPERPIDCSISRRNSPRTRWLSCSKRVAQLDAARKFRAGVPVYIRKSSSGATVR